MAATEDTAAPATGAAQPRKRVLGLLDVTLFMVSAILVVDQLTATAAIGVSSIGWWVLLIVIFFVPSALITASGSHARSKIRRTPASTAGRLRRSSGATSTAIALRSGR